MGSIEVPYLFKESQTKDPTISGEITKKNAKLSRPAVTSRTKNSKIPTTPRVRVDSYENELKSKSKKNVFFSNYSVDESIQTKSDDSKSTPRRINSCPSTNTGSVGNRKVSNKENCLNTPDIVYNRSNSKDRSLTPKLSVAYSSVSSIDESRSITSKPRKCLSKNKLASISTEYTDSESNTSVQNSPRHNVQPSTYSPSQEMIASFMAASELCRKQWESFESHVKTIDDSSDVISRQPKKTFTSSGSFQKVMKDLYGNIEYSNSRAFNRRSRIGSIAIYASKFLNRARKSKDNIEVEDVSSDSENEVSRQTQENAKRGWRILRQYVQNMAAEKRMKQSTLAWDMLRHTLRNMSNMERARRDLYQRYGLLPIIQNDGTVIQENTMLSERAKTSLSYRNKSMAMCQRSQSVTGQIKPTTKLISGYEGFYDGFN